MDTPPVNLPVHKHPLYRSSRFIKNRYCDGCNNNGPINEGYRCNDSECNHLWFHKECAESPPTLLSSSLHLQHPLVLTHFTNYSTCDMCGKGLTRIPLGLQSCTGYLCCICGFKVDLVCARKPQPLVIVSTMFHDHPLVIKDYDERNCGVCNRLSVEKSPYGCFKCNVSFHEKCVNLAPVVNHLYHSKHPLMLLKSESLSTQLSKTCVLCGAESNVLLYHCSICNFSVCLFCTTSPPRLAIKHHKTHEHQLFLMPSHISFTCSICGMRGKRSPYICLQCGFSVHRSCVDLPRVININRHDHRIHHIHQLGSRYSTSACGVCHKSLDQYYGGYVCSVCPNYAVHSKCAVRSDVWEGIELENIPEEIEDIAPFIVVGDDIIKHFSHEEHNLRFNKSTTFHDESTRCKACVRPVYSDPIYECEQCDFILHEKCANLLRKKRLVYSNKPFTLVVPDGNSIDNFACSVCCILFSGFRYVSGDHNLDISCALFSEPYRHDGHQHPLYYMNTLYYNTNEDQAYYKSNEDQDIKCNACFEKIWGFENSLHCDPCDFHLHLRCANMPIRVKSRYDDHPLFLCYGEKTSGKYWCDICETETDPAKWFYTCSDCGVTLHVKCVLGDFSQLMPGCIIKTEKSKFEVVSNSHSSSRPLCDICKSRCKYPHSFLMSTISTFVLECACVLPH